MTPPQLKYILVLLLFAPLLSQAQFKADRFVQLEARLAEYAAEYPRIDKGIDISITGTLQEFALAFSKETKLNLTIAPNIKQDVVTNFADTRPRDILLHLCKFYNLDLTFSGSIIALIPYESAVKPSEPKLIDVTFNNYNNQLELNLRNDTLDYVVKKISELSKKNIITTQAASMEIVNGYIGAADFENALQQLARRNNLELILDDKGFFVLDKKIAAKKVNTKRKTKPVKNQRKTNNNASINGLTVNLSKDSTGKSLLDIEATNTGIADIIQQAAGKSGNSFFLLTQPQEKISIQLKGVTFEKLLTHALQGTPYTFKKEGGLYIVGEKNAEGLKATKVVQLQHRSAKDFVQYIPKDLTSGVEVQEFIQLNSLILSGASDRIAETEDFIRQIDRSVPVVMIELLIIDVQKSKEVRIGLEAGVANEPVQSGGTIFSGIDFTFSSGAINRLLNTLAGNGIVNLGRVGPNFYASLQAVEDNGYVVVRSKPRLSTLNGVEASLSLGETRYYINERTTLQGNQNPVSLQDRRFEAVNADFSIRIVPIVSGDEFVTLEIDVNQSTFIGQLQTNAPPPQVNRNFNSNIRLSNQEMIVLGGLEDNRVEDSGRGVPLLARIPIIKWFFSSRRKAKSNNKLLLFVKPTIIY